MLTIEQLKKIVPYAGDRASVFLGPLNDAMEEFVISSKQRQTAFLAQVAHESGSFRYLKELASGKAYEGRTDLGNSQPGDGVRYKGRGLIQITGRANYRACSLALYANPATLIDRPELLEQPVEACRSAAWFWSSRNLNKYADENDMVRITKIINGGTNGLNDRLAFYAVAQEVLA